MGTNYYAVKNGPSLREPVHIGLSSSGWLFVFQDQHDPWWGDPPLEWHTYNQVKEWLRKYTVESTDFCIIDEYDHVVTFEEFFELVDRKQNDEHCRSNPDNFRYNVKNVDGYRFDDRNFC